MKCSTVGRGPVPGSCAPLSAPTSSACRSCSCWRTRAVRDPCRAADFDRASAALVLAPALIASVLWFLTAPAERFAGAIFWLLGAGIWALWHDAGRPGEAAFTRCTRAGVRRVHPHGSDHRRVSSFARSLRLGVLRDSRTGGRLPSDSHRDRREARLRSRSHPLCARRDGHRVVEVDSRASLLGCPAAVHERSPIRPGVARPDQPASGFLRVTTNIAKHGPSAPATTTGPSSGGPPSSARSRSIRSRRS